MRRSFLSPIALALLIALLPGVAWAQTPDPPAKLSPTLQTVLDVESSGVSAKTATEAPEVDALSQRAPDGSRLYGVTIRTTQPETIRRAGIQVTSTFPNFVVARVTPADLRTLTRLDAATRVRELGVAQPHNDVAAGVSGVRLLNNGRLNNTTYKGSGVIVCVIDSGIDYTHRDFRGLTDDTQSRILYIWDQTLSTQSGEQTPAQRGDSDLSGFDYGVEYTNSDIEDEIDGSPAGFVREEDTDGHGTHVTGTAAGNGGAHPSEKYKGMAPEADIITVKAGNGSYPFSNVIDGMNYCGEVANDQGKPVVVNMSLGANFGPHDGTSTQDEAIDNFVSSASGRAVIVSAGNEGDSKMHTLNSIAAGGTTTFDIDVPSSVSSGEFRADVWISSADDVSIQIETPSGTVVGPVAPGDGSTTQNTTDGQVYLDNQTDSNLGNGDRSMRIDVDDDDGTAPGSGTWTVTLDNTSSNAVTHHTWLWDAFLSGSVSAQLVGGNSNYTIGTPGSSKDAITIGSYVHRWRWCSDSGNCYLYSNSFDNSDDISSFSSIGPLRDGTQKPEVAAPGQGMGSSFSDDMGSISSSRVLPGGKHRLTQGTSMSAPTTTGAVALLFQQNSTLSQSELKSTLQNTARTDSHTGSVPNDRWGYGKLDAMRAMARTINSSAQNHRSIIAHDEWGSGQARNTTGDEQIAVQFTPSNDGVASGVLLHPSQTVNLSGPLNVEVWSDNGGVPGTKLGSTVSWDQNRVFGFTWNYIDLTDAGVDVQQGTDYHVVLSFSQSGDDMDVRYDDGSVDGKSSLFSGGSWSSYSNGDFRLRPVVSYAGVSGQLPVELASFNGRADGNAVVLSWTTSSETNNAGFVIEHRREEGSFERLGFKKGTGTTSHSQSYRYRTSELTVGTHTFRLKQMDVDGSSSYVGETRVDLTLSDEYKLTDVTPNPIREAGTISVTVKSAQDVTVGVYNMLGRRVAVLHDGPIAANTPTTMRTGADLPSGVYFLRVTGESFSASEKFVRVR